MNIREFHAEVERMKGEDPLPPWAKMPEPRVLLALLLQYDTPATFNPQTQYDKYLTSPGWRKRRAVVLIMAGGMCGCGRQATQVHHQSYMRQCEELFRDLRPTCRYCHAAQHDYDRMRITKYERVQAEDAEAPRLWWEQGY